MKKRSMFKVFFVKSVCLVLIAGFLNGCQSMSKTGKGAAIGVGAGALIGAGIGKLAGNTAAGAVIGAAVGGAGGAAIGKYMDKQAKEMQEKMDAAKVERVGEGILVTFDSGLLFAVNSSDLSVKSKDDLKKFAEVLNKYPDTNLVINGHTDNTGSDELNQRLSEKRAQSVSGFLMAQNVNSSRFTVKGYGETQPKVGNNTPENLSLNRRVEVIVVANADLIKEAQNGQLQVK